MRTPAPVAVRFEDVARVLDALDESGVRAWVSGGWGVAALAGRQSREHRDLDLAIDADDLLKCLHALRVLGYAAETDQLPVRIELRAPGNRWVDVHPVTFDERGHGRQAGLDGAHFGYRPAPSRTGRFGDAGSTACRSISSACSIPVMNIRPRTTTT